MDSSRRENVARNGRRCDNNNLILDFVAFGAVLSGVLVITSTNPVISVLLLISVFINAADHLTTRMFPCQLLIETGSQRPC